jgi:hypothetical protein
MENEMLRNRALSLLVLACAALTAACASAQIYELHQTDVAVGGTGQLTTAVTDGNGNHQTTTDSTGFLLSVREHPVAWAGVEVNYGFNHFSERFVTQGNTASANVPVSVHEATAAYLFHPHFRHLQPFVNVGGGALAFEPTQNVSSQWRGTGLTEVGFDVPTSNPHFGFRVQGRALIYRGPNFNDPVVSSEKWVITTEPSLSAYIRF